MHESLSYGRQGPRAPDFPPRQSWKRNASHAMSPATIATGINTSANQSAKAASARLTASRATTTAQRKIRTASGGRCGRKLPSGNRSRSGGTRSLIAAESWRVLAAGSRGERRSGVRQREIEREGRVVHQYAVPTGRTGGGAHSGPCCAGALRARRGIRLAMVSASLPDWPTADAADRADDGVSGAARRGHADRAEHPDPAAAQSGARGGGIGDARCVDRRQLRAGRRARLSGGGVRRVRHVAEGTRAAAGGERCADAPAVDRGQGDAQGAVLRSQ